MESWYIYNKKQQKQYGPYSQTQIQTFVHNQKMDETCVASNNQKKWYNSQELTKIFSNSQHTKKIGKFEIIKELGRGGMGVVYHARDTFLKYECAVKFIRLDQGIDDHTTRRFITEAQSIAKLKHPNIIGIKELNSFVDAQGNHLYYFSMDYVKGISFEEYIAQKIPLKEKLSTFLDVCRGVAYAHKNNIIHRDLKPGNIIVSEDGVPIILDFGLARNLDTTENVTKTGDIIGTPKYIAPEVMQGQKANASCDTYALGVILYEILTGFSPFAGENMIEILFQVSHTDPIPPSRVNSQIAKDGDIEVICLKCLEKKTANRIPSVQFLSEELQCFLEGKPTQTKPPGTIRKSLLWLKKNKIAAGLGVLVLVLILIYLDVDNRLNDSSIQLKEAKIRELQYFGDYAGRINSRLLQFYEKYSSSKGVHSILKDIENQYRGVQQKMEDGSYKEILTSKTKEMEYFFDSTQNIMHYFLMPSLPKILSSLELPDVKDVYQIEVSTKNDIAFISKAQKVYFTHIDQQKKLSILTPQNRLTDYCNTFYFSPDGKYLAVLFRKTLADKQRQFCSVYNTKSKQEIKKVEIKLGYAGARFSHNSRFLAYCDLDRGASLFDISGGKIHSELCKVKGKNRASNFNFSSNNRYLSFHVQEKGYYIYDVKKQKAQHVGHYRRSLFPIWQDDKLFLYTGQKLESYDVKSQKMQDYIFSPVSSEEFSDCTLSPDGNHLLWGTNIGTINYVTKRPKYTAHVVNRQQAYSGITKISFINEHFFFTLDQENHFYLRDIFSQQTIYHQPDVYYAHYDNDHQQLVVVVAIDKDDKRRFYLQKWKVPFVVDKVLSPSRNTSTTYNLVTRQFINEKYISSKPCIFIKKNNEIEALISPWHKGLSIWYKQKNRYENVLTFSLLIDIWDIKVSKDYKWVALVVHHKKLRRQSVIMINSHQISQLNVQTGSKIIDGMKVKGQAVSEWFTDEINREIRSVAFSIDDDLYFSRGEQLWKYSSGEVYKICRVPRKIRSIKTHPTAKLIVIGQEKNTFSVVDYSGKVLYNSTLQESENIFDVIAWHPNHKHPMFAISGTEGQLYLIYRNEKNMWQDEQIAVPGKKYQLSFSPNGKMLAIFTSVDTYLYFIDTKHRFPIFAGYHKNNGGNFCRDWKYAAFPTSQARMFLFDLNKLHFENFAHYFTENPTGNDKLWPRQIRDEFFEYIKK